MYPVSLKLSGFKSFAEPTEITFAVGMSAIVGPNGCGKSNIVEALRWVMGESSARQLRGAEMDEMIFGGSSERPPFSRAEVTLTLENPTPSSQQETDSAAKFGGSLLARLRGERRVALSRRIETGGGSTYRINGKEALARDVQTLCADIGLGANASAIIAQGRVASLIEAKPSERRQLIEEAAGVRGLYARRAEALASMDNTQVILERVEDRLQERAKLIQSLSADEARAERYRNLSQQIKRWQAADLRREQEALEKTIRSIQSRQKAHEQQSEQGRVALATIEASMREAQEQQSVEEKNEIESAARCQSLAQDMLLLERSLKEGEQRKSELKQRKQDLARAHEEQKRALEEVEGLWQNARQKQQQEGQKEEAAELSQKQQEQKKHDAQRARKKTLTNLTQELVLTEQRLKQLASALSDFDRQGAIYSERLAASRSQKEQLEKELEKLAENIGKKLQTQGQQEGSQDSTNEERAKENLKIMRDELRQAEAQAQETQSKTLPSKRKEEEALSQEREHLDTQHRKHHLALTAERDRNRDLYREASSSFSQTSQETSQKKNAEIETEVEAEVEDTPLVLDLEIPEGLATALFGALGEDLFASLENKQKDKQQEQEQEKKKDLKFWRVWKTLPSSSLSDADSDADSEAEQPALSALSVLPSGVVSLAELFAEKCSVPAPAALRARLACVGLVGSAREGEALQGSLSRGQRLVARDGACWRWDGLATSAALAAALEQRFRAFLQKEKRKEALAKSEADLEQAVRDYEEQASSVARRLLETRERMRVALEEQARQGKSLQEMRKRLRAAEVAALERERYHARQTQLAFGLDDARAKERSAEQGLQQMCEREQIAQEQATLTSKRESLLDEQSRLLAEQQREQTSEERTREEQRARVENEQRLRALRERHRQLLQRSVESMRGLESETLTLEERPLREQKQLVEKRTLHRNAEGEHRERKNALEKASGHLARLREQHRQRSVKNTEAEKEAVRLLTQAEPLPLARQRLAARSLEEMDCSLEELGQRYNLEESFLQESAEMQKAARRAAQDKRARLGEINFTAKQALQKLEEEHEQTQRQHDDVTQALEKLRLSVRKLEEEASGKLVHVQQEAGVRFAALIERLFGGGEAKLFFSDPEDPITSGLEIRIALPGKRLKSLSVLSGGEQALVAIALVLAVFSVAGGGFCILDEVDAALDDTNVARFCDLIEDIARQHETRFLVITHHRHTMSRALRLYGVAMPEPGCSRIVSVALDEAVEQARPAAE